MPWNTTPPERDSSTASGQMRMRVTLAQWSPKCVGERLRLCLALLAAFAAIGAFVAPAVAQVDLATVRARAEQGDPEALNILGNAYSSGKGVPQDAAEALRFELPPGAWFLHIDTAGGDCLNRHLNDAETLAPGSLWLASAAPA